MYPSPIVKTEQYVKSKIAHPQTWNIYAIVKVRNNQKVLMWLSMDNLYYWTVMLSKKFWEVTSNGARTWDPNYTPGVDFLNHDYKIHIKIYLMRGQTLFGVH